MRSIKGMRFFVTGGAGFVGSNMLKLLMDSGADVLVYDNFSSGRQEFLNEFSKKRLSTVSADLLDKSKISKAMDDYHADAVIHFAANPDVALGMTQTDLDLRQGTVATYNILDEARRHDVKDIIFSSSSVVYGVAKVRPTPETYGPLLPISLYGASKLACEGLITAFSHLYGMNYYIYRFANVIGRNSTHGVVFDFIRKLKKTPKELEVLGDGKQKKSYIDVQDCVNAMMYIYKKYNSPENLYNLATVGQTSAGDIAKMVIERASPGAKIRYTGGKQGWKGDVPNAYLDNTKMLKTGFKPRFMKSMDAVRNHIDSLRM